MFKVKANQETPEKTGCGIGLSLTKALIKMLNGKIKLSSIIDSGTIVDFWI